MNFTPPNGGEVTLDRQKCLGGCFSSQFQNCFALLCARTCSHTISSGPRIWLFLPGVLDGERPRHLPVVGEYGRVHSGPGVSKWHQHFTVASGRDRAALNRKVRWRPRRTKV